MMTSEININQLYADGLTGWDLMRDNYAGLQNIRTRAFIFDDHSIHVQFNPNRIISTSAKVDSVSISERACFLCAGNRPPQQSGIIYRNDYIILINPYPIAGRHLTIPSIDHTPQLISGKFGVMLKLAKDLSDYTVIYNGAKCGASAPDHFHFQAIEQGLLPIETDFKTHKKCRQYKYSEQTGIFTWENYLRDPITLYGKASEEIEILFYQLLEELRQFSSEDEPMINILVSYTQNKWAVHVFPRKQHRPHQYYEKGEKQLLLSPASIDMGGVLIMPREADYKRITKTDAADIYQQVCIENEIIHRIVATLIRKL